MRKISYYSFINPKTSPGIARKVVDTCIAMEGNGYLAKAFFFKGSGLRYFISQIKGILRDDADIFIFRSTIYNSLLFCVFLYLRLSQKYIIIDVPTPIRVVFVEIQNLKISGIKRIALLVLILLSFPISFWPANRILQYSDEHFIFRFGVNSKTKYVTNGIIVNRFPMKGGVDLNEEYLVFIGVAMFQSAHGYDRMIRSIAYFKKYNLSKRKVIFYIVGDGPIRKDWEELTNNLGLCDSIIFTGLKNPEDLNGYYEKAHIGIGSLAPFRNKIAIASELKLREYCARGLPFIKSNIDFDFPDELDFVYNVSNSNDLIDIKNIIDWYESLDHIKVSERIRKYAEDTVDMRHRVKDFLS